MRDRILDATEQLLGRLGYQKTTIEDIAVEAGISRRTIYLHFSSKEEVALGTIDRIVDRLIERLEAIAGEEISWESKLRNMLLERVLFRFDSVRGYFHSIDDIFRSLRPAYLARRASYFEKEAAVFARVLAGGRKAGVFGQDASDSCAAILILATNALLPSALSRRELGAREEVEERASRLADLLVRGLLRQDARPRQRPNGRTPWARAARRT